MQKRYTGATDCLKIVLFVLLLASFFGVSIQQYLNVYAQNQSGNQSMANNTASTSSCDSTRSASTTLAKKSASMTSAMSVNDVYETSMRREKSIFRPSSR